MRVLLLVCVLALTPLAAPTLHAEDAPAPREDALAQVLAALQGDTATDLAKAMAQDGDAAKAMREKLAKQPEAVEAVARALLEHHAALAARDGDAAVGLADWALALVSGAVKEAAKDPHVRRALWQANLARGRIGILRKKDVKADHWCTASDTLCALQADAPAGAERTAAMALAAAILEEGAAGPKAPTQALATHAQRVCGRLLREAPNDMDLRRALAASCLWQASVFQETSRRAWQKSLGIYFDAFEPIARHKNAETSDVRAWNENVSAARRAKLDLKADYVSRKVLLASRQLSCEIPETGRWDVSGGQLLQVFADKGNVRYLTFETYAWNSVYGWKGSPRDVGGDNVKGIAGRSFDARIEALTNGPKKHKIKKKRKPKRTRFNKTLPAGIEYTIEYVTRRGTVFRLRRFFVKSVKAERTIEITIIESGDLEGDDPEWRDVVDSFDVTKKSR